MARKGRMSNSQRNEWSTGKGVCHIQGGFKMKQINPVQDQHQVQDQDQNLKQGLEALRQLEALRPFNAKELHRFIKQSMNLDVVRQPVVEGNAAPFDYLCETFFEGSAGDMVVWANRGGGKTLLGAMATLLDMIYKPGIQICILGGSMHQSSRMYEYLRDLARRPMFAATLKREPTERTIELANGSRTRLLSHSPRMVRGEHIHKLRCDEVDEFQEHVYKAAQMVTKSAVLGGTAVRGTIESLSTMHKPFGPMSRAMDRAQRGKGVRVLRWSVLDVMQRCELQRDCLVCPLHADCGGLAKEAQGFMPFDDVLAIHQRSSANTWAAEMMCHRPRRDACVYPQFDPMPGGKHVTATSVALNDSSSHFVAGIDFGIRSQFVALLARLLPAKSGASRESIIEVLDEQVQTGQTLEQNLHNITQLRWPTLEWVGVDPAGAQRNSQTGKTDIQLLRKHGMRVRHERASIEQGIEAVRSRLDHGRLRIDPRCRILMQAMQEYRFDPDRPSEEKPMKEGPEGPDHTCDALRYLVINVDREIKPAVIAKW